MPEGVEQLYVVRDDVPELRQLPLLIKLEMSEFSPSLFRLEEMIPVSRTYQIEEERVLVRLCWVATRHLV